MPNGNPMQAMINPSQPAMADMTPPIRTDELIKKMQIVAGLETPEGTPPSMKIATQRIVQGITLLLQGAQTHTSFANVINKMVPQFAELLRQAVTFGPETEMMVSPEDYLAPEPISGTEETVGPPGEIPGGLF